MTSLAISKTARSTCAIPSCCRNCAGTGNFDRFGGEAFGGERLVRRRVRVIRRRFRLAPPWRKKRHANRGGQLRLVRSPLPDVPGQENGRRGTGQAGEPAGSEAQRPGREPRSPAELVERDAEQKCPEEPGTKAYAGIEPNCCPPVPRGGDGEHARGEIGKVALHDEAGNHGECKHGDVV